MRFYLCCFQKNYINNALKIIWFISEEKQTKLNIISFIKNIKPNKHITFLLRKKMSAITVK